MLIEIENSRYTCDLQISLPPEGSKSAEHHLFMPENCGISFFSKELTQQ